MVAHKFNSQCATMAAVMFNHANQNSSSNSSIYLLLVLLFPDSFTPASIKTLMPHIPDLDEDVILNYLNQMAQPSYALYIFLLISELDADMCLNQRIKETLN
jgi:hypothetical protein